MRILHVVPSYLPATRYGGPIYSVHALCAALVRRGHEVEVFTTNVDGPGVSDVPVSAPVSLDGVKVTYFQTTWGRRLYRSPDMKKALLTRMADFDLAHLHSVFLWPTSAAAAEARRRGIPYLLAPRGMLVGDLIRARSRLLKTAWIALLERRNLACAAALHATSDVEAAEIAALGLSAPRVCLVPNGVETPPEPTPATEADAWDHIPHPLIVSLGRINWKKGLDRLVAALAHAPGAHLVIAGNDEENYTPHLQTLAARLRVGDRTHFVGPVYGAAKWRLLRRADVFVLPSRNENFGNVVLEAMACGAPVIVTAGVGLARAVEDARAGRVSGDEPEALGACISELLGDAEARRSMGERGRALAHDRFSWDAIAAQMEECYRAVLSGSLRDGVD